MTCHQLMKPLNRKKLQSTSNLRKNLKPGHVRHSSIDCQNRKLSKEHFFTRQNSKDRNFLDAHANQSSVLNPDKKSIRTGSILGNEDQTSEGHTITNLSDFLKTRKFKAENPEFQKVFVTVYQEAQKMQTTIKNLHAEIRRLDTLNKYLFLGQRHKEDM